ncbi:RICIN domain-containing protein [Actinophytocola oryzae]|uniref:Ricin-type beta-trefoil lectin protein n=1 Tax=Actinophytocola oryzae TaxID=502181 RepID=A0A4R7W2M6_9PSEU|nr:ricin-type beta-trefoil lectin domain protein [Actinophytocola oryzae]TDV56139.1 ricin-type beta-trefoil lectin protein [Actinophytocola oryzae]
MNVRAAIRTLVIAVPLLLGATTAQATTSVSPTDATGLTVAAPDSVLQVSEVRSFRNQATVQCVDESYDHGLRAFPCNGLGFQQWNVTVWSDATRELRNVATGRCVDHSFDYGLRAIPCNGLGFQRWIQTPMPNGGVMLQNQATHWCVDDSAQYGLRALSCNGLSFQTWF